MFYDLVKLCTEHGITNTFNNTNDDYGFFNKLLRRKFLINVVSTAYHTPKLAVLRPVLDQLEAENPGWKFIYTNNYRGIVTKLEVQHSGHKLFFNFGRR